jgi:hypothetical protein
MRSLVILGATAALLLFLMSLPRTQAAVKTVSLEELTVRSTMVVKGRVLSSETHWIHNAHSHTIVTDYNVAIEEVLKSDQAEGPKTITLRCVGGRVGNTMVFTAVEPEVRKDESVVLFLWPDPEVGKGEGIYKTYGGFQGKFSLLGDRVRERSESSWADLRSEVLGYLAVAPRKQEEGR